MHFQITQIDTTSAVLLLLGVTFNIEFNAIGFDEFIQENGEQNPDEVDVYTDQTEAHQILDLQNYLGEMDDSALYDVLKNSEMLNEDYNNAFFADYSSCNQTKVDSVSKVCSIDILTDTIEYVEFIPAIGTIVVRVMPFARTLGMFINETNAEIGGCEFADYKEETYKKINEALGLS